MKYEDYARIIEASLNEIYIFDAETLHFVEVNRGARENLGYSLDELKRMTPLDIKPSYTLERFEKLIAPLRSGESEKIAFKTEHLRCDGTLYPVEVHLQLTTLETAPVFVAIILDITEKRRLSERNSDLGNIFEDSLNEIFIFDTETLEFIEVNRGARENLGYTLDELKCMTPIDIKPSLTLTQFNELIAPLRRKEQEHIVFETQHQRKNGTLYDVEVHLQLSSLETRPVFVAIILDITERKEAAKQLLKLTMENQRARLVHNFINDSSHEFRTSLAILNTKSYLLSKGLVSESDRKHLAAIQEHVSRLDKLVSSMQSASVLETTDNINRDPLSVNSIIKTMEAENRSICESRQIDISLELQEPEYVIYGDENLLGTAIYNIVKNACEYNRPGGEIHIRTRLVDDSLTVVVRDTGIGIKQEHLAHIFDHFYRVDSSRAMTGGSGLGLTIAKRIIALHGGRIEVESIVDQGSLFRILLPLKQP